MHVAVVQAKLQVFYLTHINLTLCFQIIYQNGSVQSWRKPKEFQADLDYVYARKSPDWTINTNSNY